MITDGDEATSDVRELSVFHRTDYNRLRELPAVLLTTSSTLDSDALLAASFPILCQFRHSHGLYFKPS